MASERIHAYPMALVEFIHSRWKYPGNEAPSRNTVGYLPDKEDLRLLFSTCYQVSMMYEEARPLSMRIILVNSAAFPAQEGPPDSFYRVLFDHPRPLNEYELRRLSPAVSYDRSLIGIELDGKKGYRIWGLVNSGTRWLQAERGGLQPCNLLPCALVVHVNGPGSLTICRGVNILAILQNGKIVEPAANCFQSMWIRRLFTPYRKELLKEHEAYRHDSPVALARIEPGFIAELQFQVLKRIISDTRNLNHGGSFVIVPDSRLAPIVDGSAPHIHLKYRFVDDGVIQRERSLIQTICRTACTALGSDDQPDRLITWKDYVVLQHKLLYDQEEALYEHAHFVASLAAVDGAVVLTPDGPVGFGGMIVGALDKLTEVAKARDIEGKESVLEMVEGVGSRHRSIYHLCNALHHVMAIVVSQDGSVQLVKWLDGTVTIWDLTTTVFNDES
ncbi:MAG: hypothetical protein CSA21_04155 [Deltaproteobacteria bacterium]|nr:MAG: hypothetical protein CSA21_04155 [Deltaproteobacteria bacterium]